MITSIKDGAAPSALAPATRSACCEWELDPGKRLAVKAIVRYTDSYDRCVVMHSVQRLTARRGRAGMSKGRPVTVKKGTGSQLRNLAVAVAMTLAAGKASALGLGEIKLHSALNEPFNAEIQLFTDRPAELDGAVVRLAPQETIDHAGKDRQAVIGDLTFTVTPSGNGTAVVRVTKTQPRREPFLDFIVQLQWPAGRLLREYTVLLDPTVFGANHKTSTVATTVISVPLT